VEFHQGFFGFGVCEFCQLCCADLLRKKMLREILQVNRLAF
jgi:hypothetical protein